MKDNQSEDIKKECIQFGKSSMAKKMDKMESCIYYHDNDPWYKLTISNLLPNIINNIGHCHMLVVGMSLKIIRVGIEGSRLGKYFDMV